MFGPSIPKEMVRDETLETFEQSGNAISDRAMHEMSRILKLPSTRERLAADGSEPVGNTPAEFGAHIGSEIRRWRALINELGIKGEG